MCTFADCPLECDPTLIGVQAAPRRALDLDVSGTMAYVVDGLSFADVDNNSGLYVIDISNPAAPVVTGSFLGYHAATDIVVLAPPVSRAIW